MKTEVAEPFPNLQWTRQAGAEDYFDRADFLYEKFVRLAVAVLSLALITPMLGVWVVWRARAPNPVQVLADGRLFSGPLAPVPAVAAAGENETLLAQMRDTVEILLTRTEQGGVGALDDFVTAGVVQLVDTEFSPAKKMASGYSQGYSVTSTRVLVSTPTWIVLGVRGLLASRTMTGYQSSELFLVAGFVPGKKTDRNMLGWRLTRLLPDPEGQMYFNEELARDHAVRFGATDSN